MTTKKRKFHICGICENKRICHLLAWPPIRICKKCLGEGIRRAQQKKGHMKFIIICTLLLTSCCEVDDIKQAEQLCSKNGGIKIYHSVFGDHKLICNNNTDFKY